MKFKMLREIISHVKKEIAWSKKCKEHCRNCAHYQFCKKPSLFIIECYGLLHPDTIAYLEQLREEAVAALYKQVNS